MIPIEGRIAPGLDEFMLRCGHLLSLSHVAVLINRRPTKLQHDFGAFITRECEIPAASNPSVAAYLSTKGLCPAPENSGEPPKPKKYRYPDLQVSQPDSAAQPVQVVSRKGVAPKIWWQDLCLSDPNIESSVGAVTVGAKPGSSTGASHVIDWASTFGLLKRDLTPTVECTILAKLREKPIDTPGHNPYRLSKDDRTVLAYLSFLHDIDLFTRFADQILKADPPITKSKGASLFTTALDQLSQDVQQQRNTPARVQFRIFEQAKELRRALRNRRGAAKTTPSTAWHRASSRLEAYVDFGLLSKRNQSSEGRFQYVYYPTDLLRHVSQSIHNATAAQDWLEWQFTDFFGGAGPPADAIPPDTLVQLLKPVLATLERRLNLFPIQPLSIGLALQARHLGLNLPIGAARKSLETLATSRPDLARLSRGASGQRAEFISIYSEHS
jgi:hypothetical protein